MFRSHSGDMPGMVQILALSDKKLAARVKAMRADSAKTVLVKDRKVRRDAMKGSD